MTNRKEFTKLCKILKKDGFSEIPRKGNHMIWIKEGTKVTVARNIKSANALYKLIIKQWQRSKVAIA